MNKRTAKRRACAIAGGLIDGALGVGADCIWQNADGSDQDHADVVRLEHALRDLQLELDLRAGEQLE